MPDFFSILFGHTEKHYNLFKQKYKEVWYHTKVPSFPELFYVLTLFENESDILVTISIS